MKYLVTIVKLRPSFATGFCGLKKAPIKPCFWFYWLLLSWLSQHGLLFEEDEEKNDYEAEQSLEDIGWVDTSDFRGNSGTKGLSNIYYIDHTFVVLISYYFHVFLGYTWS
jgi:hypothetical protein